jgi:segregation and condensation protein B
MIIFCSILGRCIKFKEEKIEQLEWKNILICLLFISEDPLTIKKIEETTGLERKEVLRLINELIKDYEDSNQPLRIYEIARGYKIGTKTKYFAWVKKMTEIRKKVQISSAALETLAIIAYNQPVTRLEIEKFRGVSCSGVIYNLLKHRFIKITGRKKTPGNPLIYKITDTFLMHFGLKNISDLPRLREIGIN